MCQSDTTIEFTACKTKGQMYAMLRLAASAGDWHSAAAARASLSLECQCIGLGPAESQSWTLQWARALRRALAAGGPWSLSLSFQVPSPKRAQDPDPGPGAGWQGLKSGWFRVTLSTISVLESHFKTAWSSHVETPNISP